MNGLNLHSGHGRASEDASTTPKPESPGLLTPEICRRARLSLGWSPEKLASAAGLSPPTIAKFEQENCTPRPGTVIALRKALRSAGALDLAHRG
jgi:predicted transcriptional regulator